MLKKTSCFCFSLSFLLFSWAASAAPEKYLKINHDGIEAFGRDDYDLAAKKFNEAIRAAQSAGIETRKIEKIESNLRRVEYIQEFGIDDIHGAFSGSSESENTKSSEVENQTYSKGKKRQSPSKTANISEPQPKIIGTAFGTFRQLKNGLLSFTESHEISSAPGTNYSWVLLFDRRYKNKVFNLRQEFSLPYPPKHFPDPETAQATEDGKHLTMRESVPEYGKLFSGFWYMDAKDPLGAHRFEIYLDEKLVGTFDFVVKKKVQFTEPEEINVMGEPIYFTFAPDQDKLVHKK